ncbi:GNAT family N-acetyltransferase [Nocardia sp. NPDC058666]|uniref:GNAT family N-acetyltransferase n=1 Tax=Nocardia sp. NPDC058666 TaxID=3346587 RepID=UPI003649AF4A
MLDVVRATKSDAAEVVAMRHAAEDWLATSGVEQWGRREIPEPVFHRQIDAGEFFVARTSGRPQIVGTLRLLWTDPFVWQDRDTFAGYVHSLVIDRAHAGTGLGLRLLDWAANTARRQGAPLLRLDCVEGNQALCEYYRRAGFDQVGRRDLGPQWHSVALFERHLADVQQGRATIA